MISTTGLICFTSQVVDAQRAIESIQYDAGWDAERAASTAGRFCECEHVDGEYVKYCRLHAELSGISSLSRRTALVLSGLKTLLTRTE